MTVEHKLINRMNGEFTQIHNSIIDSERIDATEKMIILFLLRCSSDFSPSRELIAKKVGVTQRTLIKKLKHLSNLGIVINHGFGRFAVNEEAIKGEKISPPSEKISPPSEKISPPSEKISPPSQQSEKFSPDSSEKISHSQSEKFSPHNNTTSNMNIKKKEENIKGNTEIEKCQEEISLSLSSREKEQKKAEAIEKKDASIDAEEKKEDSIKKLDSNSCSQAHDELETSQKKDQNSSLAEKQKPEDISQKATNNSEKEIIAPAAQNFSSAAKMESRFKTGSHHEPNKPQWEKYAATFMSPAEIDDFQTWYGKTRLAGKGAYSDRRPDRLDVRRNLNRLFNDAIDPDNKTYVQECMTAYIAQKVAIERTNKEKAEERNKPDPTDEQKAETAKIKQEVLSRLKEKAII